nr:MAG: internal scaffolding protein [Microviridae sp.]
MKKLKDVHGVDPTENDQYGIEFKDPSLTKQEFKDDNTPDQIIKTFTQTGQLPQMKNPPSYGDVSDLPTYQEAMQIIAKGNEAFMTLTAETRKYFDNDPAKFLAFTENEENLQEGVRLGLWTLKEPETEKIQKVEVINQTPPPNDKETKK